MSELRRACKLISSGHLELGNTLLLELLERTVGEVSWQRYELTYMMSCILSRPELEVESDEIFRHLVPESIDRPEFGRRLLEAVELLFHDAPTEARFYNCERESTFQELVEDLWLESGYLRWVNLYRCGTCWVKVICGGAVDTFREVLHHNEGTAPFHLLLNFERLQVGDRVRLDPEGNLAEVIAIRTQPSEAYDIDYGLGLQTVNPWELRKAWEFQEQSDPER